MLEPDKLYNKINEFGKRNVIEKLHNLYPKCSKEERIRILELLNRIGDSDHYETIENYFISDENPEVRIEAAKLLAFNYDKKKAIKPLIWMLKNEIKFEIKIQLIHLLVALSYKEEFRQFIVQTLCGMLEDENIKIQLEAIESLILIKEESLSEKLMDLAESNNKLIRLRAIRALGSFNIQKSVPFLLKNLRKESLDEWTVTFDALRKILDEKFSKILLEKYQEIKTGKKDLNTAKLRYGIAKAMGELNNPKFRKALKQMENDKHYWIREMATE
ncbi:MAG: hypothetical protein BAJALOKI2v1_1070008, partial [Promethearchaeota archaeon]